ncbi:tetratricopeptide repeat-containing sensor histidine kinase [Spirosoma endophyticum]|uniref:histidine kinase n=1 Tax=Spirosoma endophyticum TaxID=662367 RepID=A0A1I1VM72_9BACT|nr:HAMP domain-containing sensor histidine kinase [Spirosoma endophyticum]SFD83895.1 Signal transduction histidine kinase [Spirosoma endophyticum]
MVRNSTLIGLLWLLVVCTYGQTAKTASAQSDTTRLRLYCEKIDALYQQDKVDSVYILVQQALPLATKAKSSAYLGRLYNHLGLYYGSKRLLDKSINALQQSIVFLRQAKDMNRLGRCLYALAIKYAAQSDYEQAIRQSLYTLSFAKNSNNNFVIGATYTLLIEIYKTMKDIRFQQIYTDQLLHFASQTGNNSILVNVYMLKASQYEEQKFYDKAWPYYEKALKLAYAKSKNRAYYVTVVITAMENNLRHRNRFREGALLLKTAIRMNEEAGDIPGLANVWNALAQNYQSQGLDKHSLQAATKALAYAHQSTLPSIVMSVLPTIVAIQEASGLYQEALHNHQAYVVLKDSVFSQEKNEKIAQIQARYELDKKENAIQLLNKNSQIQHLKAAQEKRQLVLGMFALVLGLGIISYFLRRSYLTQNVLIRQKQEIQTQATQLEEANRLKDKLFSILGHDLRSPVASLKFSFSRLKKSERLSEDDFSGLEQKVDALSHTLDNLLYWSLQQQQGLQLRPQLVSLGELVEDTLALFREFIRQKQLRVTVDLSPAEVWMDETLSLLVLRNILHNAIKFTPPGGAIHIDSFQASAMTRLRIADTGIGMDLTGSSKPEPSPEQGTGLGLALSNELMRYNKGELKLESHMGQGTTVTLSWPNGANPPLSPTETVEGH